MEELSHQNCSFSVALSHQKLQDSPPLNQLPVATASGALSCLPGLDSREQLPEQDVVVGLNGEFVHTAQLGANHLSSTQCQAWYEENAAITAERHGLSCKVGTGERTREPPDGNVRYL